MILNKGKDSNLLAFNQQNYIHDGVMKAMNDFVMVTLILLCVKKNLAFVNDLCTLCVCVF